MRRAFLPCRAPLSAALVAALLVLAPNLGAPSRAAAQTPTRDPGFAPSAADVDALLRRLPGRASDPASDACAARRQTVADEVFILHSQMMVTSLACAEAFGQADLHEQYRRWAVAQESVLASSRAELAARLGGTAAVDAYRTTLANAESALINAEGPAGYCTMRRSRFGSLVDASPAAFSGYAAEVLARRQSGC